MIKRISAYEMHCDRCGYVLKSHDGDFDQFCTSPADVIEFAECDDWLTGLEGTHETDICSLCRDQLEEEESDD